MPSAARDPRDQRGRFYDDYESLLLSVGLDRHAKVGLALSGGPDSSALLLLTSHWVGDRLHALTVDHGLRIEAADEAAAAAALCTRLGVPHETVRVALGPGSVQAAARDARYAALAAWAQRLELAAVLTGHHADDQAETVLMRLARGSGLAGLSGIRAAQRLAADGRSLLVLRPLLGWRKASLEAICAAAGVAPARDPSNTDERFDRTAARTLLAQTGWLDAGRLAASAGHLAEAEEALAAIAGCRYEVLEDGDGCVSLRPDPLREIARRHVRRLLAERFDAHPDGRSLDMAVRLLAGGGGTTCAGILCRAEPPVWTFRRAPPRRSG